MKKNLVIVESPTKAKTLSKFLSDEYQVVSSMGHIRDLPNSSGEVPQNIKEKEWASLGIDYANNFKPLYVVNKTKKPLLDGLKKALKNAQTLILATDDDREGESISWHLLEILKPTIPVKRIVFRQISKEAILAALANYRELDRNLVSAQETRRILDRLVGYTLSPLLWKKIAYRLSAGRVQSVAVNLIVEREIERMNFVSANYWGLTAVLSKNSVNFGTSLIEIRGQALATGKDFDAKTGKLKNDKYLLEKKEALKISDELKNADWIVKELTKKTQLQKTHPPFITSTLQQDASNRLKFSTRETMRIAQKLYEKGYITYMRTDSVILSSSTIADIRSLVKNKFGADYLPAKAYTYKSKAKNAQEAHEAIHPVNLSMEAKDLKEDATARNLYDLIWKKTIASQMSAIKKEFLHVDIQADQCLFRSTGKKILHLGYSVIYQDQDKDANLPSFIKNEELVCKDLQTDTHHTLPPNRYTEASLIKFLEAKEIGRPSTYSSIISTIIDREYIRKTLDALAPTFTAFAVSKLLKENFPELTDVSFTANMESILDEIASGKKQQKEYLENFYNGANGLRQTVETKIKSIDANTYKKLQFSNLPEIKISVYGAYIQRSKEGNIENVNIPKNLIPAELNKDYIEDLFQNKNKNDAIGIDPKTGKDIYLLQGRYGFYLQLGIDQDTVKPKRVAVAQSLVTSGIDLNTALQLFALPIILGEHPKGGAVLVNSGKYGPYISRDLADAKKVFRSIKISQIAELKLEGAIKILEEEKKFSKTKKLIRLLGTHPTDNNQIGLYSGIYGAYLKHGKNNIAIPKKIDTIKLTLEQAIKIIDDKGSSKTSKTRKSARKLKF